MCSSDLNSHGDLKLYLLDCIDAGQFGYDNKVDISTGATDNNERE